MAAKPKEAQEKPQEGSRPEGHQRGLEGPQKPGEAQASSRQPGEDEARETGQEGPEDETALTYGQETFPKSYVEKLRAEAAELRVKARRAEELSARLLAVTIKDATRGILADPTDLPQTSDLYDEEGWPDPDAIAEAAKALVERKPHLADRRPAASLEQGPRDQARDVNLAGILRSLAG